jgi:DNA polymerase
MSDRQQELSRLIAYTKNYIEYQKNLGLVGFVPPAAAPAQKGGITLEQVREELGDCQRCKLWSTRTRLVFGDGDPQARLVFVGEGPGRDEDLQGLPFVGRAGQLLTRIIQSINLKRSQVYICNIIKCRPPGNRNPQPDEIASCEPFLVKQLEAIRPQLICALGTFAAQTLLRTKQPISRLRGRFHSYHGIKLMPTFHPAYLLRNPHDKRLVWEDMQLIQREYFK